MDIIFPAIEIKKTSQYMQTVNAVSDYLKDLPLSAEQNNILVGLMVNSHQQGVQDAFKQGFELAFEMITGRQKEERNHEHK